MKTAISMSYLEVSQDVGYNDYVKWIIGLDYLFKNEWKWSYSAKAVPRKWQNLMKFWHGM